MSTHNICFQGEIRKIWNNFWLKKELCKVLNKINMHQRINWITWKKNYRANAVTLILSTLGKTFSRRHSEIFFLFFLKKIGFDISCKLSPKETICMTCQSLFSGKDKKNIINLSSAESAQRVVKVNTIQ